MLSIAIFCAYVLGYVLVFGIMLLTFFCCTTAMNWAINSFSYRSEIEDEEVVMDSGKCWYNGKVVEVVDGVIQDDK